MANAVFTAVLVVNFMVQLMVGKYHDIEIMLECSTGRTIKLGEIIPEWWIK